jgi:hypothetical protein
MRQLMMTVIALTYAATVVTAQADPQLVKRWYCVTHVAPSDEDSAAYDLVGPCQTPLAPGSQPIARRTVLQYAARDPLQSLPTTCTGLKSACLSGSRRRCLGLGGSGDFVGFGPYCQKQCNSIWEHCMKTGFWEGAMIHRSADRR